MEFLNTYTQAAATFDEVTVGIVFGVLMTILLIIEIVACIHEESFGGLEVVVMFLTITLGALCFLGAYWSYEDTQKIYTYHQVTISDEVNFNEVYEKYEVIKQEGEIFTIREKEFKNE